MKVDPLCIRIDIEEQPSGKCLVLTWPAGWKAGDKPLEVFKTTDSYSQIIEDLRSDGWDIAEWGIGARAWKGERRMVRTGGQILKKRRQVNIHESWYRENGVNLGSIDLAFLL